MPVPVCRDASASFGLPTGDDVRTPAEQGCLCQIRAVVLQIQFVQESVALQVHPTRGCAMAEAVAPGVLARARSRASSLQISNAMSCVGDQQHSHWHSHSLRATDGSTRAGKAGFLHGHHVIGYTTPRKQGSAARTLRLATISLD